MCRKWIVIVVMSGMTSLFATLCFAEQHRKTPLDYHLKRSMETPTPKRTSHLIKPTQRLTHIFDNLYHHPEAMIKKEEYADWKEYKEKLRSLVAVHFSDNVQIGFDKIKAGPSKFSKGEIVDVNPQLAPKSAGSASRGFGLQVKVKLD